MRHLLAALVEGAGDYFTKCGGSQGNRPSNTIPAERLTPAMLDKLVALYEHRVFTQGAIRNINSFGQWRVELGKALGQPIIPELESPDEPQLNHDSSMNAPIRRYRKLKEAF